MLLNVLMGYVLAVVEDEKKKAARQHNGTHREGLPNKKRRTANQRRNKRR